MVAIYLDTTDPTNVAAGATDPNLNYVGNVVGALTHNQAKEAIAKGNVPFSWKEVGIPMAMVAATPFTAGASLYVGTAMGLTGTSAMVVGSAVVSASMAAAAASATGGDVGRAAITGAIGGGVSAAMPAAMSSIVGGGDQILGMAKIAEVANATGMSTSQVISLVSSATATALAAVATGSTSDSLVTNIANNLAATAIGNYAGNLTTSILPSSLSGAANAVASLSKVVTSAKLNNQSISTAVINNAGTIIGSATQPIKYTSLSKLLEDTPASATAEKIINTAIEQPNSEISKLFNNTSQLGDQYNSKLDATRSLYSDSVIPAWKSAEDAQSDSVSKYDTYKTKADEFASLVKQHDEAVAANDVTLADSIADKANALVPSLNDATTAYNNSYSTYQTKLSAFNELNSDYDAASIELASIKDSYTQNSSLLEDKKLELANAAQEVAHLSPGSQKAFIAASGLGTTINQSLETANKLDTLSTVSQTLFNKDLAENKNLDAALTTAQAVNALPQSKQNYVSFMANTGTSIEDAVKYAPAVSEMSITAQQSFFDQLKTGEVSSAQAADWAQKVNALDAKQQSAYYNAKINGLSDTQAFQIAPTVSGFTASQQNSYINSIKSGQTAEYADFAAMFSNNPNDVAPSEQNAANLAKLTTQEQKEAYILSLDRGLKPSDALKAVSDFFISPAQAEPTVPTTPRVVDPATIKDAVYHQENGQWGIYVPDSTGKLVNTNALISQGITPTPDLEGQSADLKFEVTNKLDANGVPNLSMMPYNPQTTTPGAVTEVSKADNADGKTYTVTYSDKTTQVYEKGTDLPVNTPTASAEVGATPTVQSYIDSLIASTAKTTGAGTGAGTNTGTGAGTGTTGTGTGGGSTGTNAGSVGTGSAGTGAPGTGTGGGGQGTGTGGGGTGGTGTGGDGTGTGTGGGIGTGTGIGGSASYNTWQSQYAPTQDQYGGIKNLTPGLTERMDYTLTGMPTIQEAVNPMDQVPQFATGGSTSTSTYDPFSTSSGTSSGLDKSLAPGLTKAQIQYILTGLSGANITPQSHAEGGSIEEHNPTFFSEGGLSSMDNRYVQGEGDGTSDSVAAMLANGEFVIPADVVSKLGNGSNEAGAGVLDQFLVEIRKHAHSNGDKLPPESKGPLGYLLDAKRKVKA